MMMKDGLYFLLAEHFSFRKARLVPSVLFRVGGILCFGEDLVLHIVDIDNYERFA